MNGLVFVLVLLFWGGCAYGAYRAYKSNLPRTEKMLVWLLLFLLSAFLFIDILGKAAENQLEHYKLQRTVHVTK